MPPLFTLLKLSATIASSIFVGALIFIALVMVKFWRSTEPDDFFTWMSLHFFRFPKIMVPLNLLSLLTIAAALIFSWQPNLTARLPLSLSLFFLLACSITFPIYFVKANEEFVTKSVALADLPSKIEAWSNWHWLRTGLAFISTILAGWSLIKPV